MNFRIKMHNFLRILQESGMDSWEKLCFVGVKGESCHFLDERKTFHKNRNDIETCKSQVITIGKEHRAHAQQDEGKYL